VLRLHAGAHRSDARGADRAVAGIGYQVLER